MSRSEEFAAGHGGAGRFEEIADRLLLEGVGTSHDGVPEEVGMPKTRQQWHDHMVDHHGHDSYDDNPRLRRWTLVEWQEQHNEDHLDNPEGQGHHHPGFRPEEPDYPR